MRLCYDFVAGPGFPRRDGFAPLNNLRPRLKWNPAYLVIVLLLVPILLGSLARQAFGQISLRKPTQPILLYQTKGHSGTITSIIFDPVTGQLLTAGYDKLINVWDPAGDRLKLVRTIRPPIWRALRGSIFSMALSPVRDAQGEAILAVGGFGLQSTNGDIGLLKFPGKSNLETGDLIARLNGGNFDDKGHEGVVRALAFHPDPRVDVLVSAGQDGSIRIWNHSGLQQIGKTPTPAGSPGLTSIVFNANGTRLWSAAINGIITQWDMTNLAEPRKVCDSGTLLQTRAVARLAGDLAINAMALSPDGATLVAGTEDGWLFSIDSETLTQRQTLMKEASGPIEAVAIGPDRTLATSRILHQYLAVGNQNPPLPDCVVELRRLEDGVVTSSVHHAKNRIYCLKFSPDGKALAFAGDNSQSVFLKRIGTPNLLEAKGQGSSLWDVGFTRTGLTVGLSRRRPDEVGPPLIQGFDLKTREPRLISRNEVEGATRKLGEWTIQAVDQLTLEVRNGAVAIPIQLPEAAMRWWDFTFVPSATRPANEPPLVVVACTDSKGYVFAPLNAGADQPATQYFNSRQLAGHTGPILGVAASSDGKWVVTSSDDQTARLWLVSGWQEYPKLGIETEQQNDKFVVTSVAPRSFADHMGLEKGDVLLSFLIDIRGHLGLKEDAVLSPEYLPYDKKEITSLSPELIRFWDQLTPGNQHKMKVRRGQNEEAMITSKMEHPVLSLFVAEDLEWVAWTPESYYDTSVKGDRTYLGFHTNGSKAGQFDITEDTHFFTIDRFENQLRNPKLLQDLIDTADPVKVYAGIPKVDTSQIVAQNQPPTVKISVPTVPNLPAKAPLVVDVPELVVDVVVETVGFANPIKGLKQIQLLLDTGLIDTKPLNQVAEIPPNDTKAYRFDKIRLKPGLQNVGAIVENEGGIIRPVPLQVEYRPRAPLPASIRPSELHILSFGTGEFESGLISPIKRVENDIPDLARFFSDSQTQRYGPTRGPKPFVGKAATSEEFLKALDEFDRRKLTAGDTIVIAIETHLIALDEYQSVLAPFSARPDDLLKSGISTKDLTTRLAKYAADGCHVLLILDVNHPNQMRPARSVTMYSTLTAWARDLYKARVTVCFAALSSPEQNDAEGDHNILTRAILASTDRQVWKRETRPDELMTLGDFKTVVESLVDSYSQSKQISRLYEANVPLAAPFLVPPIANLPVASISPNSGK